MPENHNDKKFSIQDIINAYKNYDPATDSAKMHALYFITMLTGLPAAEIYKMLGDDPSKINTATYTAFLYDDDECEPADLLTSTDKDEAINYAKENNWDEVVNDLTGEIIWRKED